MLTGESRQELVGQSSSGSKIVMQGSQNHLFGGAIVETRFAVDAEVRQDRIDRGVMNLEYHRPFATRPVVEDVDDDPDGQENSWRPQKKPAVVLRTSVRHLPGGAFVGTRNVYGQVHRVCGRASGNQ